LRLGTGDADADLTSSVTQLSIARGRREHQEPSWRRRGAPESTNVQGWGAKGIWKEEGRV